MSGVFSRAYVAAIAAELERRRQNAERLRMALEGTFETTPGDRRFCVRRLEVVEHVAKVLGIRVVNNRTFEEVTRAAEALGWEAIKNGNRSLFRCVKRRDHDPEGALMVARANRFDGRTGGRPPRDLDNGAAFVRG